MLTAEQVREHSEVSLGSDMPSEDDYTKSMARLLYIHNERAHRLRIICRLPGLIPSSEIGKHTEEDIKETIDWEKFTRWINRHDDLMEHNLVTPKVWVFYNVKHRKQGRVGRNGLLDTMKNEVVDCNNIVLV